MKHKTTARDVRPSSMRLRRLAYCLSGLAMVWQCPDAQAALIDVTAFGAIPNDGLDDRSAIQAAIASASSGDTVLIPTGQFHISNSIIPKSGITLAGGGRDVTTILPTVGMSASMVRLQASGPTPAPSNVQLTGFTIDGAMSTTVRQGIEATSTTGLNINGLRVQNLDGGVFGPHGIYFSANVTNSVISGNEFLNIGVGHSFGGGIRIEGGSNFVEIVDNVIDQTGRGGIFTKQSTHAIIRNNTVTGSGGTGLGIELFDNSNFSIVEDNQIDHWLSLDKTHFTAVRRNVISDTSGIVKFAGIEMATGGSNNIFTDNTINQGALIGISLSNNGVKELSFFGHNTISGTAQWGSQLQADGGGIQQIYFLDNTFELANDGAGNEGHGFRINGNNASGVRFLDLDSNRFINNEKFGFQIGGSAIDQLRITNNTFTGNGSHAFVHAFGVTGAFPGDDLLWSNNTVSGNGGNSQPASEGFATNQLPGVDILAPLMAQVGESIAFDFSFVDDGTLGQVLWDFGDGVPMNTLNPTVAYGQPGLYRVTLIAWDDGKRAALDQHFILITNQSLAIPEPATLLMMLTAGCCLMTRRKSGRWRH